jgi:nuclear transcription factor Y gamma
MYLGTKEMNRAIDNHGSSKKPMLESKQQMIHEFWRKKQEEIEAIEDFNKHAIPMRRLKKVISGNKGKMMMRFDTPSFLTKVCEIFVQELSLRAWMCAHSQDRRIILDSDIADAIASMDPSDFFNKVLPTDFEEYNPSSRSKPIKMKHHHLLIDKPSTPTHLPSYQYQMPQFIPQSIGHSTYVHISPPLSPRTGCHVPLSLRFAPHEPYPLMPTTITPAPVVSGRVVFTGNNISKNSVDILGVMTPLPVPPTSQPNIPNNCYMSTISSTSSDCVGYANGSNVVTQDGGSSALQCSSPSRIANNNGPIATCLNHMKPKVAQIKNGIHVHGTIVATNGIDPKATTSINDGQNQHRSLDAEVSAITNISGYSSNINWDEVDMADDSLLIEFWEDVIMNKDLAPSTAATSITNRVPFPCDIPKLEEFDHELYLP